MPALNFKEIPQSNIASGQQDTFELFARDFLQMLGFKILSGPDRGQDGGRDLLVLEKREGIVGETQVKWLVSCKHKAHSSKSVIDNDEKDIRDRVEAHGASGFIGFYSTLVSSPLGRKLEGLKQHFEIMIFDNERIENELLTTPSGNILAKRYFPKSYSKWELAHHQPANILSQYEPLKCRCCGKDLLSKDTMDESHGLIAFVEDRKFSKENLYKKTKYVDFYWACKGRCDRILEHKYHKLGYSTPWEDISDIVIPAKYVSWNMAVLNRIRSGVDIYEDVAFENMKKFVIRLSQLVLRNQTDEQLKRLRTLASLPPYI